MMSNTDDLVISDLDFQKFDIKNRSTETGSVDAYKIKLSGELSPDTRLGHNIIARIAQQPSMDTVDSFDRTPLKGFDNESFLETSSNPS